MWAWRWLGFGSLVLFVALSSGAYSLAAVGHPAVQKAEQQASVVELISGRCFQCHGEKSKKEAGLNLERLLSKPDEPAALAAWVLVAERINDGSMPPPLLGVTPLEANQKSSILRWISSLPRADAPLGQNSVKSESMRLQPIHGSYYLNALRDLFEVDFGWLRDEIPSERTESFSFSKWLSLAESAVEEIVRDEVPMGHLFHLKLEVAERARKRVLNCSGESKIPEACLFDLIARMTNRAWGRPASSLEMAPFQKQISQLLKRGRSVPSVARVILESLLVSENFLYRPENREDDRDYRIARRLADLIWNSLPDEELLENARLGKFTASESGVKARLNQAKRMLRDRRSEGLGEILAGQWLQLDGLEDVFISRALFPEVDDRLRHSMRREAVLFLQTIFRENRPIHELIDSRFTFVDAALARHYDLPGVFKNSFQRQNLTSLDRGGVIGLAGVLTVTSFPERTSPTKRGKWVLEQLLCRAVPPPPPGVPALPPEAEGRQSLRKQLEVHKLNACASCHITMDPLGFALENFNAVGKWRTLDDDSSVIDSRGNYVDGSVLTGIGDLKRRVATSDELPSCLMRKLSALALNRNLTAFELGAARELADGGPARDKRAGSLLLQLVGSDIFKFGGVR